MTGVGRRQRLLRAHPQAAQLRRPGRRAFNHPAGLAQAAAMRLAGSGELGAAMTGATLPALGRRPRGAVALQPQRAVTGPAARARNGREGIEQGKRLRGIVHVGGGDVPGPWGTLAIGAAGALYARLGTAQGIGAGVRPPQTARLAAESITARDQSSAPARRVVLNRQSL